MKWIWTYPAVCVHGTNMLYKQGLLISEQQVTDTNPLFHLATIPRDLTHSVRPPFKL